MADVPQQREFTIETAHAAYEALSRLGFAVGRPEDVASILSRLDAGLPHEDEFIAIVSWLGRCPLVHRLDQQQGMASREVFKIPDLMALFRSGDDVKPFLIEVKTTNRDSLKWSTTYHTKLTRYAKSLDIPLLLAWKYRPMGMWTLCDITHLKPGVRFEFTEAMRQNLMGVLAGDIQIVLKPGLGIHFVTEPIRFLGDGPAYADNGLLMPGNWEFRIVDAYFTNGKGERLDKIQKGLWPVLLATSDLEMESDFQRARCVCRTS